MRTATGKNLRFLVSIAVMLIATATAAQLPTVVDNSDSQYFPPIRTQGSYGSCAAFSSIYYTMTYTTAMARGWDVSGTENTNKFTPRFSFNQLNQGAYGNGTYVADNYEIAEKNGGIFWSDYPYVDNTSTSSYWRAWPSDKELWRGAIRYRIKEMGYISNANTQAGIDSIKEYLANGYILNFSTDSGGGLACWYRAIGFSDNPGSAEDDPYLGQSVAREVVDAGTSGHAMTIVGYNDDLWLDYNSNSTVDAGETGAFKIANSWGTSFGSSGFCWLMYDAMFNSTNVSGYSDAGTRVAAFSFGSNKAYWMEARESYEPTVEAEFTMNHLKRQQINTYLGVGDTTDTTPDTTWESRCVCYGLNGNGGDYAFDGTTTACDMTFVMDMSDLAEEGTAKRYFLKATDRTSGDTLSVSAFKIIAVVDGDVETSATSSLPATADASDAIAYCDYTVGAARPIVTSPVEGEVVFGGDGTTIAWDTNSTGTNVQIELRQGDSLIANISASTANDGSHSWSVPNTISTDDDYFIRITDLTDSEADDSAQFTIVQPINSYPYAESFESGLGDWGQASDDDDDWTRNSGGTTSGSTGPDGASDGSYYLYTEASAHEDETFSLVAAFDLSILSAADLGFDYHMYGASTGSLYVDIYDGSWNNGVWSKTGQQQSSESDAWDTAGVSLDSYVGDMIKIRLRGVTGSAYTSDMAIDNIEVTGTGASVPEIDVSRAGGGVNDGGEDVVAGTYPSTAEDLVYTIANDGASNLTLTTPITVNGASNCSASCTSQPSSPVAGSGSTSATVRVTPTAAGVWSFDVSIANNDGSENPYNWTVSGVASVPELTYSRSVFDESFDDDGSIDNTSPLIITLGGDSFTGSNGDDFIDDGDIVVTNLPVGLTAVATRMSATELSVTITGQANSHTDADDVSNLSFTFQDSAFTGGDASAITNYAKSDLSIDFFEAFMVWLKLDESSGTTAYNDASLDDDGTLAGDPSWSPSGGKIDGALDFDGTGDYVNLGQPAELDFTPTDDDFTVSCWFKTSATGALISKVNDYNLSVQYYIYVGSTGALVAKSGGDNGIGSTVVNDGAWHMATLVNDASTDTFTLYLDGAFNASGTSLGQGANSRDILIGARRDGDNSSLDFLYTGLIDDVRIYGAALSATEVDDLYNSASTNISLTYSGSVFDEADANDGSIDNAIPITITLTDDSFTGSNGDDFVDEGKIVVTNMPAGLTAVATRISATELSVTITGNASNHTDSDDVSDLTFAFQDTAFTSGDASAVANATKSDLAIDFDDTPVPSISIADDGGVTEGSENGELITVTLTNATFAGSLTPANWTVTNLPTGVSKGIVTRVDGDTATIALSGDRTVDYDSDITNVTVECTAAEHSGGDALSDNTGVTLTAIDETISYSSDTFSEAIADDGSIANSLTITLSGDTFAADVVSANHVAASNVPAGLSASFIRNSGTEIAFSLTGNASSHADADDISNLTVTFDDDAFDGAPASFVTNATKSDLSVDFTEEADADYTVGASGADFTTIAAAIAACSGGEVIEIIDAVHTEDAVTIDKNNLTIQGRGMDNTIVQAAVDLPSSSDRVFLVDSSVSHATIKDMTMRYGDRSSNGGAIYSYTDLTLEYCRINDCRAGEAGGALSMGSDTSTLSGKNLTVTGCVFDNCESTSTVTDDGGGAIFLSTTGEAIIIDSSFTDNTAASRGGAVRANCDMTITGCAISGNTAAYYGGGAYISGATHKVIENSTFHGNDADTADLGGGGMYITTTGATVEIYNSTIAANSATGYGGGMYISTYPDWVRLYNSIVADNTAAVSAADIRDGADAGSRTISEAKYNLVESGSGNSITNGVDGNIVGSAPVLGSLQNNGGPTDTIMPGVGSPALRAIPRGSDPYYNDSPFEDQRGYWIDRPITNADYLDRTIGACWNAAGPTPARGFKGKIK